MENTATLKQEGDMGCYLDQMDSDTRREIERLPVHLRERAAHAIADGFDLDTSEGYNLEVEYAWQEASSVR